MFEWPFYTCFTVLEFVTYSESSDKTAHPLQASDIDEGSGI